MFAGIDLGGTNIAAGLVSEDGKIIYKDHVRVKGGQDGKYLVTDMVGLLQKLCCRAGITLSDLDSIGIGSPGLIDSENGVVRRASNLDLTEFPMAREFKEQTGVSVKLENDANCAAYAESRFGASRDTENSMMITLGTGIGGGIIVNRKIYTGHDFGAGEIGHMVIRAGGRYCPCGRYGCFEAYASATGLIRTTKEKAAKYPKSLINEFRLDEIDGKTAFEYARRHDEAATEARDEYIRDLAVGIGNIVRVLYPDVLVVGGGISMEGNDLFIPLREAVRDELSFGHETKILKAELGNDAGIVGAAIL